MSSSCPTRNGTNMWTGRQWLNGKNELWRGRSSGGTAVAGLGRFVWYPNNSSVQQRRNRTQNVLAGRWQENFARQQRRHRTPCTAHARTRKPQQQLASVFIIPNHRRNDITCAAAATVFQNPNDVADWPKTHRRTYNVIQDYWGDKTN